MKFIDVYYRNFALASIKISHFEIEKIISEDEICRMKIFKGKELQDKYGLSRYLLRSFLAEKIECQPNEINIEIGIAGRPYIAGLPQWDFNLSHSKNTFLVAVGSNCKVGVDVEHYDDRIDYKRIARRYFHPLEVVQLEERQQADRVNLFLQLWTLKEAFKKASEISLSDALATYAFIVEAGIPRLAHPHDRPWYYQSFRIGHEWAAVACQSKDAVEFRHAC
jgi:4'-phosphopantetheinyl transferase